MADTTGSEGMAGAGKPAGSARGAASATDPLNSLARGAGVGLSGKIGGRLIHLVAQVAFARLLGPEGFGLYALGFTLLRIITLLTPLGLPRGAIYFGSRHWRRDESAFVGTVFQAAALTTASGVFAGAVV